MMENCVGEVQDNWMERRNAGNFEALRGHTDLYACFSISLNFPIWRQLVNPASMDIE